MKLTVLTDDNVLDSRYLLGEHGLSFYIEEEDKKILFDAGYSDIFLKNSLRLNIDLKALDLVVVSHGHRDHSWGLVSLVRFYNESRQFGLSGPFPTLIAHPNVFFTKSKEAFPEVGSILSEEKAGKHFDLQLTDEPVWITDKLVYLGEIPRKNDFENQEAVCSIEGPEGKEDDYILDDTALAYQSEKGLVIIAGCAHSGICNIIEYAKKVCETDKVVDIIGGFHLLDPEETQLDKTVEYFEELNPEVVHACHCTDQPSKLALSQAVYLEETGVGLELKYN